MDDLKLYGKSKTELAAFVNTVRIFTSDIQMVAEVCHIGYEKRMK